MFHHLFFKKIVTRTAIGLECLTALHLNCGKTYGKLNQISTWRKKTDYTASLLQHSTLIDILKHLLLPSCTCLTDNWWSAMVLAMVNIGNGHWRNMVIEYCSCVPDRRVFLSSWSDTVPEFLKPDITVTVPEGRCCCSVSDIKYYCWVKYTVLEFLKLEIVDEILKLSRVTEFLISVRSKVLFIKALLAIVYCIAQ